MTSIIKLQPLTGGGPEAPHCYMLQVDDCSILLDCGWDEKCSLELLDDVIKNVSRLDAVLLSYADPLHLGALPYLVGKAGLNCPIYATVPTFKLGQLFMYDVYQSRVANEEFTLFTLDDVDLAFDRISQLKYNQTVSLKGRGLGLTLTPLNAGHMVGGTIWKIVKDGEEDILYAVDFNHKRERHLNGCVLESLQRPSLLITDAFNATYKQDRRRTRDEQLMTRVLQTMRKGGDILVATDTGGRVLELVHMVDQLWKQSDSGLSAYNVAVLNNVCFNVIEFAKSLLEWMSERLMRTFEGQRNNPFSLKHVVICHTLEELDKVRSPKVILASGPDMESGFSRDIFLRCCGNERDAIILTQRTSKGTLARSLIDGTEGPPNLRLTIWEKVPLEGDELEVYLDEKERQEREREWNRSLHHSSMMLGSDDDDDEDDDDDIFKAARRKDGISFGGPMFSYHEDKHKFDDYGEALRSDEFKYLEVFQQQTGGSSADGVMDVDIPEASEGRKQRLPMKGVKGKGSGLLGHHLLKDEVPSKYIESVKDFSLRANVSYIDFEGRSDGDSNKKLLAHIKPRRVLLVRGTPEALSELRAVCQKSEGIEKVLIQNGDQVMDATTESHIYQVLLKESLLSSIAFISCGGNSEVAWINARVRSDSKKKLFDGAGEVTPEEPNETESDVAQKPIIPSLEPIFCPPAISGPEGEKIEAPPPKPIDSSLEHPVQFINDLKLSDFKQILANCGIDSEFTQGTLWCVDGTVALKRISTGQVVMEGTLTPQFYQIRNLLYGQYAVI